MRHPLRALVLAVLLVPTFAVGTGPAGAAGVDYAKDVEVLLDTFESEAGALLKAKGIDWGKVRKEFRAAAKKTKTDEDHVRLCWRLVARLRDGHAGFEEAKVKLPEWSARIGGPRVHLVTAGKGVYVRASSRSESRATDSRRIGTCHDVARPTWPASDSRLSVPRWDSMRRSEKLSPGSRSTTVRFPSIV